jgi:hypothetical protein
MDRSLYSDPQYIGWLSDAPPRASFDHQRALILLRFAFQKVEEEKSVEWWKYFECH